MKITAILPASIDYVSSKNTVTEAVAEFRSIHPGGVIEAIDDREVFGWCEDCGLPIFDGEDHEEDEEGICWHAEHRTIYET